MALFAGLGRGGATRAGAASGGRGLREKVNARRGAQTPETEGFGGPTYRGWLTNR